MKAPDEKPATEICAGSTGRFFRDSAAYAGAQESANRSAATLAKRDMTNAPGETPPPRHIRPMLARCKCAELRRNDPDPPLLPAPLRTRARPDMADALRPHGVRDGPQRLSLWPRSQPGRG